MARISQLAEPDPRTRSGGAGPRRGSRACGLISTTVREDGTVVNLPDHSTLAFLGSASLDQITFIGWGSARPVWRVIRSPRGRR